MGGTKQEVPRIRLRETLSIVESNALITQPTMTLSMPVPGVKSPDKIADATIKMFNGLAGGFEVAIPKRAV